jgi:hypothetical protein
MLGPPRARTRLPIWFHKAGDQLVYWSMFVSNAAQIGSTMKRKSASNWKCSCFRFQSIRNSSMACAHIKIS